ncbi:MAG: GNAT family N-acetyltransferase [Bacteroidetes bacterium]|nr:GNAT family N-acetyltransferase [Bacteroidota bacterium]
MEKIYEVNINNLYSLLDSFYGNKHGVSVIKTQNYTVVASETSVWPNIIYRTDEGIFTDNLIEEFIYIIKKNNFSDLILLENSTQSYLKLKDKGFFPIEKWIGMTYNNFANIPNVVCETNVDIFVTIIDSDLEKWAEVVSVTLFNKKIFDTQIVKYLISKGAQIVIAKSFNVVIGTALIWIDENNIAGIYMVSVIEKYRGMGVGRKITRHCLKIILERNINLCILQATKLGVYMYENIGFERTGSCFLYKKIK